MRARGAARAHNVVNMYVCCARGASLYVCYRHQAHVVSNVVPHRGEKRSSMLRGRKEYMPLLLLGERSSC